MSKTMSIRMDRENFAFLNELTKEQRSDLSKAVRDLVTRGRTLLAVERAGSNRRIISRGSRVLRSPRKNVSGSNKIRSCRHKKAQPRRLAFPQHPSHEKLRGDTVCDGVVVVGGVISDSKPAPIRF